MILFFKPFEIKYVKKKYPSKLLLWKLAHLVAFYDAKFSNWEIIYCFNIIIFKHFGAFF